MIRTLLVVLLFTSSTAYAGAWDTGAFDNDDALDMVYELTEGRPYQQLWRALGPCMSSRGGYLQSPDGSRAVAAAALIAANLSGDVDSVPEELKDFVSEKSWAGDVKLVGSAEYCMRMVTDPGRSELAELWADSGLFDEWSATIAAIMGELKKD